jgi:hypothetical protein
VNAVPTTATLYRLLTRLDGELISWQWLEEELMRLAAKAHGQPNASAQTFVEGARVLKAIDHYWQRFEQGGLTN